MSWMVVVLRSFDGADVSWSPHHDLAKLVWSRTRAV